jgi:hypothetical protein
MCNSTSWFRQKALGNLGSTSFVTTMVKGSNNFAIDRRFSEEGLWKITYGLHAVLHQTCLQDGSKLRTRVATNFGDMQASWSLTSGPV